MALGSAMSFPREYARTQRFTLGEPRAIQVTANGGRIVFVRSRAGDDPQNALWVADAHSGEEYLVADPAVIAEHIGGTGSADDLPDEERQRRERLREGAGGITSFALDGSGELAVFALGGRLGVADLSTRRARASALAVSVTDPKLDPTGRRIGYVSGSTLRICTLDREHLEITDDRRLVGDDGEAHISWGSPDFIAAEEMRRYSGFWWNPTGEHLAVCRVDVTAVDEWFLHDAATPEAIPRAIRYPAAGTANATTSLHLVDVATSSVRTIDWDHERWPYLADVHWGATGLLLVLQTRDQRHLRIALVDPVTLEISTSSQDEDSAWVELVGGLPRLLADGRLLSAADRDGARRLLLDGIAITPATLQVRSLFTVGDVGGRRRAYIGANPIDDATSLHVWAVDLDGGPPFELRQITTANGVHHAVGDGGTLVIRRSSLDDPLARHHIYRDEIASGRLLTTVAHRSPLAPRVELMTTTEHRLATAVLVPGDHDGSPLPVLLDPYGGPHAQRVIDSYNAYVASQWFADQGFAVVIVDGRGTPGRGSSFERAIERDLATPVLDDQIAALDDVAQRFGFLDLERVAIRGWSFGGYLAALAVLRRPDRFHAAIAGAPVTEWRLYDTHYTERYLGDPTSDPGPYEATSLLPLAAQLRRPLLLIHGLADDNVVAAHSLQLSAALLAAGRPHETLLLSGVSHMTPQEVIAENLLHHQLDFLERSLDRRDPRPAP